MTAAVAFLDSFVFDPDQQPPDEENVFGGFLSKGDLAVWIGREKHRKTNVVLQFGMCSALGRDYLSLPYTASQPLKVVYVDYESKSRKLWERYQAMCSAMGLTPSDMQTLKTNLRIIEARKMEKYGQPFQRFPVKTVSEDEKKANDYWTKFAREYPADLYIFDPMRCFHGQDENDSNIESLLARLRQVFKGAGIIIPHHMTKRGGNPDSPKLRSDMRAWSDGARGSGAIKAHSDVIVCQERVIEAGTEKVYWGAFGKDEADIEPIALEESDPLTFYWQVSPDLPAHLQESHHLLKKAGGKFDSKKAAVEVLVKGGVTRKTAYRHLGQLQNQGLFTEPVAGEWTLGADPCPEPVIA